LHAAVDSPNDDQKPKQTPEGGDAEHHVHHNCSDGADEHRAFAPKAVGQKSVYNLAESISKERGCNDVSHLRFCESELATDRAICQRQIVTAHVKRGVKRADEGPVESAPAAKSGRMSSENGIVSHGGRLRRNHALAHAQKL